MPTVDSQAIIDMHVHVGLCGDVHPEWGHFSAWYRRQLLFRIFLRYSRLPPSDVTDPKLRARTEAVIDEADVDHVVCLALDHVYDEGGAARPERSNMWVHNDYVLDLRRVFPEKVLLGASVHPYAADFEARVRHYADEGAVFLKWLPSAQQIDLAHPKTGAALRSLATARAGKPLPLLLHVGPEYAIPSTDSKTETYDFLSWGWRDRIAALFSRRRKPDLNAVHQNLRRALDAGGTIIFAHCGLPYFGDSSALTLLEHSDFKTVRRYLDDWPADGSRGGRCFADVSACATPFRALYFPRIRQLPPASLLFGSDFPTPVFELSADANENWRDFRAVMRGQLDRVAVPQDNLISVNYRELRRAFPGHPMFVNANRLVNEGG